MMICEPSTPVPSTATCSKRVNSDMCVDLLLSRSEWDVQVNAPGTLLVPGDDDGPPGAQRAHGTARRSRGAQPWEVSDGAIGQVLATSVSTSYWAQSSSFWLWIRQSQATSPYSSLTRGVMRLAVRVTRMASS